MKRPFILICLGVFLCIGAHAHGMKVFAESDGDTVKGSVYFVGGNAAKGVVVHLKADGSTVATTKTDGQGKFAFNAKGDQVVAETADGHQSSYKLPTPAALSVAPKGTPSDAEPAQVSEVERKVDALHHQLMAYENRARIRDVLGGIGYILGIMGVILYFKAKRLQSSRGEGN